jgi:hypothetical protein
MMISAVIQSLPWSTRRQKTRTSAAAGILCGRFGLRARRQADSAAALPSLHRNAFDRCLRLGRPRYLDSEYAVLERGLG